MARSWRSQLADEVRSCSMMRPKWTIEDLQSEYPYRYAWNRCERKDKACKVNARGKMNSCEVEFTDGFKMITSRNALRRWNR